MRRLIIGDIHGGFLPMRQALERAEFNAEEDMLIGIGDYVDGWPQSKEVLEYLMGLPNFKGIKGNHDYPWFTNWTLTGDTPSIWINQGGSATVASFNNDNESAKPHGKFILDMPKYLVIDDMLIVHGGYDPYQPIEDQLDPHPFDIEYDLTWDRQLFSAIFQRSPMIMKNVSDAIIYKKVFIGHTTTEHVGDELKPLFSEKVIAIDQGGGWSGKLTVMDIDTLEYWQSDIVATLYPECKGRG